jgi:arylsulfatase A-like enzyme
MIFMLPTLEKKSKIVNALVEYVDVVPTILELTGNQALSEVQGKSFASLISGEKNTHRDYVFSEYLQDNLAMVATKKWKYVFHTGNRDLGIGYATGFGPSGITHSLYDLENDLTEGQNVASKQENKEILANMQNIMLQHFMATHPDTRRCPKEIGMEGKLVWFCEPRDIGADQDTKPMPLRIFGNEE